MFRYTHTHTLHSESDAGYRYIFSVVEKMCEKEKWHESQSWREGKITLPKSCPSVFILLSKSRRPIIHKINCQLGSLTLKFSLIFSALMEIKSVPPIRLVDIPFESWDAERCGNIYFRINGWWFVLCVTTPGTRFLNFQHLLGDYCIVIFFCVCIICLMLRYIIIKLLYEWIWT